MDKNILLILALVIGLILGYGIAFLKNQSKLIQVEKEAKKELVQKLRDNGFIPPAPEEIMEVTGTVKGISQEQLTLKPEPRFDDPLGEFFPNLITVRVTGETKIYKIKERAPEVLREEEQEFNEKVQQYEQAGKEIPPDLMPPEPFTKQKVKLSEIEKGQRIRVTADKNIKGKSEFEATTIEFEAREEELPQK